MGISVNTSPQQITASVGETQIDVSVSGGFGPSGAAGSNGQAATVAVGTVTTGAAGSSASVTNVGTSSAAVLNFTIPAGATGAAGATGPAGTTTWAGITDKPSTFAPATHTHAISDVTDLATTLSGKADAADIRYKGEWSAGEYDQGDIVYKSAAAGSEVSGYIGTLWVCTDLATSDEPDGTTAAWTRFKAVAESHQHGAADVTFAATDRLLGRSSSGAGAGEEITCTAAGRAILDDATAADQRTTLSAQKTITSGTAAPTGGSDGDIYLQYT